MNAFVSLFCVLFTHLVAQVSGPMAPVDPAAYSRPVRVACVGDSITEGAGIARGQAYPDQLQKLLGGKWEVRNFGVSARTLLRKGDFPYWNEKAFKDALAFEPDVVIILLGANDTKPHNWKHRREFAGDYADLVKAFRDLAGKPRVYACRPCPVPGAGNFGINEKAVQEQIKIIDRLARTLDLGLIDMHAALADRPELLPDRVHPNAEGAAVMAETVRQVLTGKRPAAGGVVPHSYFASHAVLPREVPVPVWGSAPDGAKVEVEFAGQKVSTVAKDGRWSVTLQPLAASPEPRCMVIRGEREIVLEDMLVGDVWLASGQSNMARQLGSRARQKEIIGAREEIAAANRPLIRQYFVPLKFADAPVDDPRGKWSVCTPATAPTFTAVGYFFARDLQPAVGVPVGIIFSSWGGTVAEAWTSEEALKALPQTIPGRPGKGQNGPSKLYHAMIAPLTPIPIKGVIWYQGEANSGRGLQYREMLPALIGDWRRAWKQPELPFLFVQIAPHERMTPELREAQMLTACKVPRTAMAVLTDVGDAKDIHPVNKAPVGSRLALAARALAYGEKIEYSGPLFREARPQPDGKAMWVAFDHVGGGLVAQDGGPLRGFVIAGEDRQFVAAQAEIRGDKVIVWSDAVPKPVAVRYGWANVPDVNLANKEGLPASPFRSDGG